MTHIHDSTRMWPLVVAVVAGYAVVLPVVFVAGVAVYAWHRVVR